MSRSLVPLFALSVLAAYHLHGVEVTLSGITLRVKTSVSIPLFLFGTGRRSSSVGPD